MLFTLFLGTFPLVLRGTNHAAFDQLACGVYLVNFRRRGVGVQFRVSTLQSHTHTRKDEVTPLPSAHVQNGIFPP
jgi:hypothetical protein